MNTIITHKDHSCLIIDGHEFLIDTEDIPRINCFKWIISYGSRDKSLSYLKAKIGSAAKKQKTWEIYLHRLILSFPKGCVDHKNRNIRDNRKCNLREATTSQNASNRPMVNSLGYRGITKAKTKYNAIIGVNGKYLRSRAVATREEAARLYDEMALKFHGEFALLNFENP
jgi:hypothetical protein